MEVVTLVGGFRGIGLGDLTTSQAYALGTWLQQSLVESDQLIDRVRTATAGGQIATSGAQILETQYESINSRASALLDQVTALTDVNVAAWRAQAAQLVTDARAFNDTAHLALGDLAMRGLKLTLLAVGSVALFGGTAWVIYRYGKRKHPRRRR